jgi:hypothetical protein
MASAKVWVFPALVASWFMVGAAGNADAAGTCPGAMQVWTQVDLYFGRNKPGGEVTEQQFRQFLSEVVTPRFPDGLTVIDADGQFHDGKRIVRERSKHLVLLVPEAREVRARINQVIRRYKERFQQQSVLHVESARCVSFD